MNLACFEKNTEFVLENVGTYREGLEFDEATFINVVKKHTPTVITIAFCYTNVSVINDMLRLSGIYASMILSRDRADITEDRCMLLDPTQKQVIKTEY